MSDEPEPEAKSNKGNRTNHKGIPHPLETRRLYHRLRFAEGINQAEAAEVAGVSKSWAYKQDRGVREGTIVNLAAGQKRTRVERRPEWSVSKMRSIEERLTLPPIPHEELSPDARQQLEDFHYFCEQQFGVVTTPWRRSAFNRLWPLINSDEKEFVVFNAPPGCGKSQFISHDLALWLTVRNRRVRGLIGSVTEHLARPYCRRIRTSMERTLPLVARDVDKRLGLSTDAATVLAADFGRFRTDDMSQLWQANQFTIDQMGGLDTGEKEPTWQAYGRGSEILGNRQEIIFWDDLVTKRTMAETTSESFVEWFEDEAEPRLEPGGIFILNGQRMGKDLYRNRLDSEFIDIDADGNEIVVKSYHHIIFPAHVEANCTGDHHRLKAAFAEFDEHGEAVPGTGCLLDPRRVTWGDLSRVKRRNKRTYEVVYQQNEYAEGERLLEEIWLSGGESLRGELFIGCRDLQRGRLQFPEHLDPRYVSAGSVDPSSSKNWSVQWWLHEPTNDIDHLIDLYKGGLTAGELLSFNPETGQYYGMMDEWQRRSAMLGKPMKVWFVETNAAQAYLLQHQFVYQWMRMHGVTIVSHKTHQWNKHDAEHGFWGMRNQYKWGKIRLPYAEGTPHVGDTLEEEGLRWDGVKKGGRAGDDALMAQFIYRCNIHDYVEPAPDPTPATDRAPSWLSF